jgi:hypothetical protein
MVTKMEMNPIEVYIKKGYEVMNALIENADITTEECPTVNIQLKLPLGGVIFGGYAFAKRGGYAFAKRVIGNFEFDGWEKGMTAIFRIMEVAGVDHWNKLKGSPVRAILKDDKIYAIAHFLEDKVMDYRLAPFQENACL